MNPLFQEAGRTASGGMLLGVMTIFFLLFFAGWALWAYAPHRKAQMEEAGRMPLDDGGEG